MVTSTILAGCVGDCKAGTDAFWSSSIGGVLGAVLAALGILVVIVAVLKGFGKVTSGKMGEAVKIALGAAVLAAFLFNPQLFTQLISLFSGLAGNVIDSGSDIVNSGQ